MRYVLHFNPEGTKTLLSGDGDSLEFVKLPKALTSGATTKVRLTRTGAVPFTPRDETGNRYGAAVSESYAKLVSLKGRQRYTLQKSGSAGFFNLVPHSRIGKKAKRIGEAGVSVSVIER
jgi:hypothetical protein